MHSLPVHRTCRVHHNRVHLRLPLPLPLCVCVLLDRAGGVELAGESFQIALQGSGKTCISHQHAVPVRARRSSRPGTRHHTRPSITRRACKRRAKLNATCSFVPITTLCTYTYICSSERLVSAAFLVAAFLAAVSLLAVNRPCAESAVPRTSMQAPSAQ